MVISRAGCALCRTPVLKIAQGGHPARLLQQSFSSRLPTSCRAVVGHPGRHLFTSSQRPSSSGLEPHDPESTRTPAERDESQDPWEELLSEAEHAKDEREPADSAPWYLEVDAPRHSTHIFEPAPLPELPPDSPTLLEHVLKYASEELGLDELRILDLREMEPPPALGPNLIMMFGTARGERHLHVSAGRVVRWLRANHGVGADADGKLGPEQLKTKLKRKRKKEALLGARGVRTKDFDDGISTGWICVKLGAVGPRRGKIVEYRDEEGRFAGFGDENLGLQTTIVLQMLTESKRKELNLEDMWERSLERSREKRLREASEAATSPPVVPPMASTSSSLSQRRPLSTAASQRRFFSQNNEEGRPVSGSPKEDEFDVLVAKPDISDAEKATLEHHLRHNASAKLKTLIQLRRFIDRLPSDEQKAHLQESHERGGYMYLAHVAQDVLPSTDTFMHRQWLYTKARQFGLPGYPFRYIRGLVDELRISGVPLPSRSALLNILEAALWPAPDTSIGDNIQLALKILVTVDERATHQPLVASDVIANMIGGLSRHVKESDVAERDRAQALLYQLLVRSNIQCPKQDELLTLLRAYASQENWEQFWTVWDLPSYFDEPRTPLLFTYVLRTMAGRKHQLDCQKALRRVIEPLALERPKIRLPLYPALVEAAMDCVRVADPNAEKILDEVQRLHRRQLTPKLTKLARGEFVLMMAQLREKELIDTRGPPREPNKTGPTLDIPYRDRNAYRMQMRAIRRAAQKLEDEVQSPTDDELFGR